MQRKKEVKKKACKVLLLVFLMIGTVFLGTTGLFFPPLVVHAEGFGNVELTAEAGIVMDADTGAVLFAKNADAKEYPASITKVLTALVVLEHCSLEEKVTFSHDAVYNVDSGSSNAQIEEGDVLTVNDCLYALLLKSANEAANALAEHVAGSKEAFVEMMNKKAAELGCTESHFQNPSGLFSEEHYTTARDMGKIAIAAFQNEEFLKIEKNLKHTLSGLQRLPEGNTIYMEHKMMLSNTKFYDKRVVAGKTGFTKISGNTLLTLAKDGDRRLVTVVLKDKNPFHYSDTKALLDYGFSDTENKELENSGDILEKIRKSAAEKGWIEEGDKVYFPKKVLLSLPKGSGQEGVQFVFSEDQETASSSSLSADDKTASSSSLSEGTLAKVIFLLNQQKVGESSLVREQNIRVLLQEASPKTKAAFFAVTLSGFSILIAAGIFLFSGGALYGAKNIVDERKRKKKWKERRKKRLEEMKISEEEFRVLLEERKRKKK